MIRKFLELDEVTVETKADGTKLYNFVASTDTRDRQGDVVVQSAWKLGPFKKNPVILWAHNYSLLPIGNAVDVNNDGGKLRIKVQFHSDINPFAQIVESMVERRALNAVSVGFMVYKREPLTEEDVKQRPNMKYGDRLHGELLEVSVVPVPANPEALQGREFSDVVRRGFGEETVAGVAPDVFDLAALEAKPDPRKVRAAVALLLGARGGVPLPETAKDALMRRLKVLAAESGAEITFPTAPAELEKDYADVWSDEVLDLANAAEELRDAQSAAGELAKAQEKEKAAEQERLEAGLLDLVASIEALRRAIAA
jgi:HK97 family phage prohead protease